MTVVYLLWHVRRDDEYAEDAKLIGVYSSAAAAERASARLADKPGFRDHPRGFQVSEYPIDKDHWTEGFFTVE